MSTVLTTIIILFFIKLLRDSLYLVWLWQVKEYRIDRMISRLKEDGNLLKNNISYLFAIFLFIALFLIPENYLTQFLYIVLLFFIYNTLQIVKEIKNRSLKRPKQTIKTLLIFSVTIILYFLFFAFYWIYVSVAITKIETIGIVDFLLFTHIIAPFLIAIIIFSINPFFNFQKRRIIKKATLKMRRLKKVKVIGITGSYGKTSTKEFLYQILSQKYKVIKTEGNNNTNIGVAYTVLNKVSDDYDYFICEMGAYKIGEIAEICEIVKPKIGILTGINEQHIDLFGSIENTIKAKFELIESLPENGLAVINEKIKNHKSKIKVRDIEYFSKEFAINIKYNGDCIEFSYKNKIFKTSVLGRHYIENIISAIISIEHLGINLDDIEKAVKKIKSTEFMIRRFDGPNNSVFIDDSYSANPDGVIASLDYLNEVYRNYKKIIVFPGIIELGNKSKEVHKKLFRKIEKVCDVAYILKSQKIKKNYIFTENGELSNRCEFIFEKDFEKVTEKIRKDLKMNTVVLFESRGARVVMGKLKN